MSETVSPTPERKRDASFDYRGDYRVQSRLDAVYSELRGEWFRSVPGLLDSEALNRALGRRNDWIWGEEVRLEAAKVSWRTGSFRAEPDILYKAQFFAPAEGSEPMPVDVVDVDKAVRLWHERRRFGEAVFEPEAWSGLNEALTAPEVTVANEYFCHEAGHLVGYDVRSKYAEGYFRVNGKAAWPLIFVEELRADLQSFGFAVELLPRELAVQTFLYNIGLRLGLDAASLALGTSGYGSVPYLLFHHLYRTGFLSVTGGTPLRVGFSTLDPNELTGIMERCAEHARSEITSPEVAAGDATGAAIRAASYFRERVLDRDTFALYEAVLTGTLAAASEARPGPPC